MLGQVRTVVLIVIAASTDSFREGLGLAVFWKVPSRGSGTFGLESLDVGKLSGRVSRGELQGY